MRRSPRSPIRVRLADRVVPLTAIQEGPTRFTRLLSRAKSEVGHAECLCRPASLKLVVRVRAGRYHLAGWPDSIFPDFVLTDEPLGPVYVEVYGMTNLDSYQERKRIKQEHYRAQGIRVIEWDVVGPLPELEMVGSTPAFPRWT